MDWAVVIGTIKVVRTNNAYWLYENEGPAEGEGMEITGKLAEKFEKCVREFYDLNF